ncbi:MAG TPA: hypothetical protein VKF14_18955 [Candidatus Dormibacteraeota bacterium]|nr:hypothetical protein [Candidatus Dormibacteraeota bacterium]
MVSIGVLVATLLADVVLLVSARLYLLAWDLAAVAIVDTHRRG